MELTLSQRQAVARLLARNFTDEGHLIQTVPWEWRGVCAASERCTPSCGKARKTWLLAQRLLYGESVELAAVVERDDPEA